MLRAALSRLTPTARPAAPTARWPRGAAQSLVAHAARADDGDAVAVLCRVGGATPEALREACESNAWKAAATLLVCGADATGAAHVARRCGHVHLATAIDAGLDAQLANGATLRAYASRRGDGYALAVGSPEHGTLAPVPSSPNGHATSHVSPW